MNITEALIFEYPEGETMAHRHMSYVFNYTDKAFEELVKEYVPLIDGMVCYGTPIPTIVEVVDQVIKNVNIYCQANPDKIIVDDYRLDIWRSELCRRLHQMSALQIAHAIYRDSIHSSTELMVIRMRRMHEVHLPTAPIGKIIKDCCTVMSNAGRYYTNPQYGIHEEVFAAAIQAMLVENIRIKEISGTERHLLARTIYDNRLVPRLVPMLYEVIKNAMSLHSERSNNDLGVLDYSARIEASFLG